MPAKSKVVWTEGMFLQPQHFQQHDRYIEGLIHDRCFGLQIYDWGFYSIKIDSNLLSVGKFGLIECRGIFPDGTPFNLPEDDELPTPLDIPEDTRNEIVFLSLPLRRTGACETDHAENTDNLARFRMEERQVKDNNTGFESDVPVQVGKLKVRLLRQSDERSGYSSLGIAQIVEMNADRSIIIDNHFIPANLNCIAISQLNGYLRELFGMLNTRGESIAGRVIGAGHGSGVAEVTDFLLLQLINRYQVLFEHFTNTQGLHPEVFYRSAVLLAGEMATYFRTQKRPDSLPAYNHDDLKSTFAPVMESLRELLGQVIEPNAVQIPLSKPKFGVYAAKRPEPNLLNKAVFVLAANAQIPPETLRGLFPQQVKIGPVEEIQHLVNSALPGIPIQPLSVAPRQIPFHMGFTYFELNQHGPLWEKMINSAGFAIQVGGNFPGLKMEFWAIRKG